MILIFGLCNDETKYLDTKHNIGRIFVEKLANGSSFLDSQSCFVCKKEPELWLAFNQNYMNTSGQNLAKLIKYFKLESDLQVLIVQDDSDQNCGSSKLSIGGGTAGHNGIISCYSHLKSFGIEQNQVWRLKIGIRPIGNRQKSETFVLSKNSSNDIDFVTQLADKLNSNIDFLQSKNIAKLQNILNQKTLTTPQI
jgi:peptidyl-tRNA hydrolase, PTH1 family